MKRVLFIDDERFPTAYYIKFLQLTGRYLVIWEQEVGGVLLRLQESFDAVILDIMMPSGGELPDEECKGGMTTGIAILKRLRTTAPHVPVLVLTNVKNDETLDQCRGFSNVRILSKLEFHPARLRDELDELLV